MLFPRKFYEIDAAGKPIHYSPYNGEVRPGYMYTDTGFWDTFRCLFPLLNLVYPSVNAEIQAGLANTWRESGFLPEWASPGHRGCMVGNNSASVVSDAILKGVTPAEDVGELYEAMMSGRTKVHPEISSTGRLGHEYYNTLGYVPCNVGINENVARTLEYAYDDWRRMPPCSKRRRRTTATSSMPGPNSCAAAMPTARSRRRSAPTSGATPTPKETPGTIRGRCSTTSGDWPS